MGSWACLSAQAALGLPQQEARAHVRCIETAGALRLKQHSGEKLKLRKVHESIGCLPAGLAFSDAIASLSLFLLQVQKNSLAFEHLASCRLMILLSCHPFI